MARKKLTDLKIIIYMYCILEITLKKKIIIYILVKLLIFFLNMKIMICYGNHSKSSDILKIHYIVSILT